MKITKNEAKYIGFSLAFALIWFFLLMPPMVELLKDKSPFWSFLVFTVGLSSFFFIFIKGMVSNIWEGLRISIGSISIILATATFLPGYHITVDGALVAGEILGTSTPDYMWGTLAQAIGLQGFAVAFFGYLIMPAILLFLAAWLIPDFTEVGP